MNTYKDKGDASLECAIELQDAGVPIVLLPPESIIDGVDSRAGGELGGFTFRRTFSRYYWVVRGPMPLDLAERIYANPDGRYYVRAGGHGSARHPRDETTWRAPDGRQIAIDPGGKQRAELATLIAQHPSLATAAAGYLWCNALEEVEGALGFVELYHVDTAGGLRLLADTIKSLAR
jgi:hypothetical protein